MPMKFRTPAPVPAVSNYSRRAATHFQSRAFLDRDLGAAVPTPERRALLVCLGSHPVFAGPGSVQPETAK